MTCRINTDLIITHDYPMSQFEEVIKVITIMLFNNYYQFYY